MNGNSFGRFPKPIYLLVANLPIQILHTGCVMSFYVLIIYCLKGKCETNYSSEKA